MRMPWMESTTIRILRWFNSSNFMIWWVQWPRSFSCKNSKRYRNRLVKVSLMIHRQTTSRMVQAILSRTAISSAETLLMALSQGPYLTLKYLVARAMRSRETRTSNPSTTLKQVLSSSEPLTTLAIAKQSSSFLRLTKKMRTCNSMKTRKWLSSRRRAATLATRSSWIHSLNPVRGIL